MVQVKILKGGGGGGGKSYKVYKCGATLVWSNKYHIGQVDSAFGQVKLERHLPGGQVVQKP